MNADLHLIATGPATGSPGPEHIGGKAHNLARMAAIGLRVPPAFVLGTAWCARAEQLGPQDWAAGLDALERSTGQRLGDPRRPLLLSVRSGAPVSMPGMMETLLDIGLNDQTVHGLIRMTGNPRLAWDAYRRLVAGFGETVLGVDAAAFETDLQRVAQGQEERELDFAALRRLTRAHLDTVQRLAGTAFPQDARQQLQAAIAAVFRSWHADKAVAYRALKGLESVSGTAVTVQRMVFGNAGGDSGAGVGFTRHPSTGEARPWVDFLFNAQGEDVVSGRRRALGHEELERVAPQVWTEVLDTARRLEEAFGDMQDFEFTVERGRLFLLQTREGKRTPQAAARIALDLCDAGRITPEQARQRTAEIGRESLSECVLVAAEAASEAPWGQAQSACAGVAVGEIALDAERLLQRRQAGADCLLVRQDAETGDIAAIEQSQGLLTARGARTSHAAVVARQLGKVCLVGCDTLTIDLPSRSIRLGERRLLEGEILTLDGHRGEIHGGALHRETRCDEATWSRLERLRQNT